MFCSLSVSIYHNLLIISLRHSRSHFSSVNFIMVRDRLPDLFSNYRNNSIGRSFLDDICIQLAQNRRLQSILDDADKIRRMIDILQDDVNIIKNLHNNNLCHINSDNQAELKKRTSKISQTAFQIRNELEMKKKNTDLLIDQDKKNHDDTETSLFVDNFLDDTKVAIYKLSELQSRHTEIIQLENSLLNIRDMFSQLAFLVEKQGGQVNCVEYFAGQASDQVDHGRHNIAKTKQKNKKRKKKIRCLSIFLIIITLIFLIVIIII